eukprot:CAMPEP_0197915398 /NCGR_PEP_ID=MMETSP1439-20131203/80120_1 /TAXON_ID=66791 /ORGANISM="Gonyaulax spinifera, Strain CCMP409" /LENGTH=76 /DNA_ID=CAMNT_0043537351 /DNA_START=120 /DNA_END=347 /DNA_ORIENTATION=-
MLVHSESMPVEWLASCTALTAASRTCCRDMTFSVPFSSAATFCDCSNVTGDPPNNAFGRLAEFGVPGSRERPHCCG